MSDDQYVEVSVSRNFIAYSHLWHIAEFLFERARDPDQPGSNLNLVASLAFSAFTFEAFLNHVGWRVCGKSEWEIIEKKLSPIEKLGIICPRIGVKPEWGTAPWQAIKRLISLRNTLAHGKDETIKSVKIMPDTKFDPTEFEFLDADWFETKSLDKVNKLRSSCRTAMQLIHDKANMPEESIFLDFGEQFRTAKLVSPREG